ncbi:MAG: site-2 protease family protein [Phycisphaerales bacterium]|nr:site-2 protease family protein [Phycisphaerales bacterium]
MNWWVHQYFQAGEHVRLISQIFWVVFSITLHELAHGWAAIWQGDDTPRRLGRMTMNPLVHMGPWSLLMFALVGIAWGVMPVDPSRFRWRRRGRIVVSFAGPAMNIALALVALTAAAFWINYGPDQEPLRENVFLFLTTGGWLNIFLAAFNLLPFPPLDGAGILMGFSFRLYQFYQNPQAQMVGMLILIAIFMSDIRSILFVAAMSVGQAYLWAVARLLP